MPTIACKTRRFSGGFFLSPVNAETLVWYSGDMNEFERGPKSEIEDVRVRFMDYIGNALNGVLGELSLLEDGDLPGDDDRFEEMLKKFFDRVELFLHEDFEEAGNITHENLEELLDRREEFLEALPEKANELREIYNEFVASEGE